MWVLKGETCVKRIYLELFEHYDETHCVCLSQDALTEIVHYVCGLGLT